MKTPRILALSLLLSTGACGHAAGTRPHDMSATQHQAAADQEESQASQHAAQHDPGAQWTQERCTGYQNSICWTETVNPTQEHKNRAEQHRTLAAQHRAASQALQDAEASACKGIDAVDRDMSPFAHTGDIRSVSELHVGKDKLVGATIVFRAISGLTAERLQSVINCHLARNAAMGYDMAEMTYCPLALRGVQATVRSVGDGFAVTVRSDDKNTAMAIWQRAQQLTPVP